MNPLKRSTRIGLLLISTSILTGFLAGMELPGKLVAANLVAEIPFCNLQTEDGRVVDLSSLCGRTLKETPNLGQIQQLLDTLSCTTCSLAGANLAGANLRHANLSGSNLSRANLSGANLQGSNLNGANLSGANLSGANLSGANLSGANLNGTTLPKPLGEFTVDDRIVSNPAISLGDPEYDQEGFILTWQDNSNRLWVAQIDPVTGDFIPNSGQGQLLDQNLATKAITKNGPEWVYGKGGSQIVYTRFANNRTALARARWIGTRWQIERLQYSPDRLAPIGSKDTDDSKPRLVYRRTQGNSQLLLWREIDNPASEAIIPNVAIAQGRWVEGQRSLIVKIEVAGVRQCATYDVDRKRMTQLTFDRSDKGDAYMWKAPEFNNELVFFCMSGDTSIDIYRQLNGSWMKIKTIDPPSPRPYIFSPEPFVYNGKSYISMVTQNNPKKGGASDIWIAGIDPNVSFYRQVSDSTAMDRRDPESFITARGAFIYYTEALAGLRKIHRCDTGLGLP